ncbi:MAG TPA: ABC transporter permease, partial [Pyrinomonadaceae bacterium]
METLICDIRYAVRSLAKQPGFIAVCVFSIALGIGVNTALFSFVNTVLFRPLAFPESQRLVRVWDGNSSSYPDYKALRDDTRTFSGLAAYAQRPLNLTVNDSSERVYAEIVTGNYFDVLQARPMLGRAFLEEEDRTPNTHPVIVISNSLWRSKFNSDTSIVGRVATINKQPFTVVGVMPEGFVGATVISPPDLWLPIMMQPATEAGSTALNSPDEGWLMMLGRLKPDVSVIQAQTAVETIAARLHEERRQRNSGPEERGGRVVLVAQARGLMVPPQGRTPMLLVMAILMTVV